MIIIDLILATPQWMWAHPILSGPVLLVMYVLTMHLWVLSKGTWYDKPVRVLTGLWFIPADVTVNIVAATVICADLPREFLVTGRLQRYRANGGQGSTKYFNGTLARAYRATMAGWLCKYLNKYDIDGEHC